MKQIITLLLIISILGSCYKRQEVLQSNSMPQTANILTSNAEGNGNVPAEIDDPRGNKPQKITFILAEADNGGNRLSENKTVIPVEIVSQSDVFRAHIDNNRVAYLYLAQMGLFITTVFTVYYFGDKLYDWMFAPSKKALALDNTFTNAENKVTIRRSIRKARIRISRHTEEESVPKEEESEKEPALPKDDINPNGELHKALEAIDIPLIPDESIIPKEAKE